MNKLTDARLIDLARHARAADEVIVAEAAAQVPFRIERIFTLTAPAGVLWNTVQFRQNESVLIVLCDRIYEADDYIRDYSEFLSFRESVRA